MKSVFRGIQIAIGVVALSSVIALNMLTKADFSQLLCPSMLIGGMAGLSIRKVQDKIEDL